MKKIQFKFNLINNKFVLHVCNKRHLHVRKLSIIK